MNLFRVSPVSRHALRRTAALVAALGLAGASRAQDNLLPVQRSTDNNPFNVPVRPVVICFPPTPPPLDRAISHAAQPMPPRFTPPAELAADINEPFYAPLSTWLLEKALTDKMRERLSAYHSAKTSALTELRAALEQVREADAATRRRTLAALARQQTPSLAALEHEAEQIRTDLAIGNYDWRSLREWTLGEKNRRGDSPMEIAATLRAYAYYQAGLTGGQRRLLREISLELAVAGEDTAAAEAAQPFLFFSPEPARVLLPDDMPAGLAAKVAAYQTKKSALKKDLYDAVYKQDNASIAFFRNSALKSLADRQSAPLADLEKLADEIRDGLAELPSATRPLTARSSLPPVVTARLQAAVKTGIALQKEAIQKIDALRAEIAEEPFQISYTFESSGLKFTVNPRLTRAVSAADARAQLKKLRPRLQRIETQLTDIAEHFGRGLADLVNETAAIRTEAAEALGNPSAATVDAALVTARSLAAIKDSEDGYREYRLAVFEPGMSPEQRRLLFSGAVEKLDVPLLRGEFQPVRRAAGW